MHCSDMRISFPLLLDTPGPCLKTSKGRHPLRIWDLVFLKMEEGETESILCRPDDEN